MKKLTKGQAKAFAQVIKAMKRAQSKGLMFYGKQWSLVAINKETAKYESDNDILNNRRCNGDNEIENFSCHILADSGADDYANYLSNADDPYKGEFQETPIWQDYL